MIKQGNRNSGKDLTDAKGVFQGLIACTKDNIPLPTLLKVKKGIFYIPSLYTINEGLARAINQSLRHLDKLYDKQLYKAIF